MVALLIEVFAEATLLEEIECGELHNLRALGESLTEATRMCETSGPLLFIRLLGVLTEKLLDELDLQHRTIAIIDVGKAVRGADG